MKKLFMMLLFLFLIYFGIQFAFRFIGSGHSSEYKLMDGENTVYIKEDYTRETSKEHEIYYINININDSNFEFEVYKNFASKSGIVSNVEYYKGNDYECIYVTFSGNRVINDVMCQANGQTTYYHDIINPSEELKAFVEGLSRYNKENWIDNKIAETGEYPLTIYSNNILKNVYIGISNYQGIYTVNNDNLHKYVSIQLFKNDNYSRPISTTVGKYYLTADYSETSDFKNFKLINLTNNKIQTITYSSNISFDSYVQGVVGDSAYIFDKTTRRQYEINTKTKKVTIIGNSTDGIKYYNLGTWENRDANEAYQSNLYFIYDTENTYQNNNYYKIDKVGSDISGYYYLYKRVDNGIEVYRSSIKNTNKITYLFKASSVNNVQYVEDNIYFIDKDELKYYNDATGLRTLLVNEEFNFNTNLYYSIYTK